MQFIRNNQKLRTGGRLRNVLPIPTVLPPGRMKPWKAVELIIALFTRLKK
jgi:hypothetical protein